MSKAEKFISDYTKNCSNEIGYCHNKTRNHNHVFYDWISPDQARRAVEIAKEEVMGEVCDYIKNNLYKHLYVYDGQAGFPTHQFINDLKQAMKDE
jgi:hypothetical protein